MNPFSGITPFYNPEFKNLNNLNFNTFQKQRLKNLNSEFSRGLYKDLYGIDTDKFHRYDYTYQKQYMYNSTDIYDRQYIYYHQNPLLINILSTHFLTSLKFSAILFRFFIRQQTPSNFDENWNSENYKFLKLIYIFFKDLKIQTLQDYYTDNFDYEYVEEDDYLHTAYEMTEGWDRFEEKHGQTYLFDIKSFRKYKFIIKWRCYPY